MTDALTIVIADDHPLIRRGVADLQRANSGIQLLGEASDGEAALHLIRERRRRVAVLDVGVPHRTRRTLTRRN